MWALTYKTLLTKSDLQGVDLTALRASIESVVPHGGPGEVGCWPGKTIEELPETVQHELYAYDHDKEGEDDALVVLCVTEQKGHYQSLNLKDGYLF